MTKANQLLFRLFLLSLLILFPLNAIPFRDISTLSYESRSNSLNVWNLENALIVWVLPENPFIFKTGVIIFDDFLLLDIELGTTLIWPDMSYSQLSYEIEIKNLTHSLFFDLTHEWESSLLTTGLKASYSSSQMGGVFFLGYKYIQRTYSLWGRTSFSLNTVQNWNSSFWGEGEWKINETISLLLGFTSGGYKRDDESDFRGMEFSGLTGMKLQLGKGYLQYRYKLLNNYDYWSQGHTLVFDIKI